MKYSKAFQNLSNVTISDNSPRNAGETEANSEWKEIDLGQTYVNRLSVNERIELVNKLSAENSQVWFKTATGYGKARLFVKA